MYLSTDFAPVALLWVCTNVTMIGICLLCDPVCHPTLLSPAGMCGTLMLQIGFSSLRSWGPFIRWVIINKSCVSCGCCSYQVIFLCVSAQTIIECSRVFVAVPFQVLRASLSCILVHSNLEKSISLSFCQKKEMKWGIQQKSSLTKHPWLHGICVFAKESSLANCES